MSLLSLPVYSQGDPTGLFRSGEQALLEGETEKAIRFFRQAVKANPGFSSARRSLGVTLMLVGQFEEAADQFDAVLESDSLYSRALYYQSGLAHYNSGHFQRALGRFMTYDSLLEKPDYLFGLHGEAETRLDSMYRAQLPLRVEACRLSDKTTTMAQAGRLSHLDGPINTPADEYFPFISNDGQWMYFTRKKLPVEDEDLYVAQLRGENWTGGRQVLGGLNTSENEGMGTFVRNGSHLFFTACGRAGVLGTCDLWRAEFFDGEIIDFNSLGETINSDTWDSQAAVSCDGSVLYFSSYREGGYGGADIWMSKLDNSGRWTRPENLGPQVNTAGDEEAPFITNDGKSLFFSSNGLPGLGESDIFVTWLSADDQWTLPVNLGAPVNSPFHELGFFLSADNKKAFISSDRPGGKGNMDIYLFELPETLLSRPITYVQGKIYDVVTQKPIRTSVKIGEGRTLQSDEHGRFFLCVPADATLDIRVLKRGYAVYQEFFLVPEHDNTSAFALPVGLRPLGVPLSKGPDTTDTKELVRGIEEAFAPTRGKEYSHNVYFEFNSSDITPDQQDKLIRFIQGLPSGKLARLDIAGYTDTKGTVTYNLRLSEERAERVGQFLQANQLKVSNMFMKGVGEFRKEATEIKKRRVEIRIWIEE